MVLDLAVVAKDATKLPAEFRLGGALPSPAAAVKPGHNPAFPGLVVVLSTTGAALGGPTTNLANLFQIVSPSLQADGSMRVSVVWTNAQASFGNDVDVTLVALTVSGTAPDALPQNPSELSLISNVAQVTFHMAGGEVPASAVTSSTTPGSTTTTSAPGTTTTTTTRLPTAGGGTPTDPGSGTDPGTPTRSALARTGSSLRAMGPAVVSLVLGVLLLIGFGGSSARARTVPWNRRHRR